jgi:uncharacterized protein YdaT
MPWNQSDAAKKTHKANTPAKQRQWVSIANRMLAEGASDATAIRVANGVVKNRPAKKRS